MNIKRLAVTTMAVIASLAITGFLQAKMTFQRLPLRTAPEVLEPAPGKFYGGQDFYGTNIALGWSNAAGVAHYWVQRGIFSPKIRDYVWTDFCLSSNASFFVDKKPLPDDLGLSFYRLFAEYPNGSTSKTDVWYSSWLEYDSSFDFPPIFPPTPQNVQASVDLTSNVVVTWEPAQGAATNYVVIRAVYNPENTNDYDITLIGSMEAGINSVKAVGVIKKTNDLGDAYEVAAIFPGNVMSSFTACFLDTNMAVQNFLPLKP
jgi:hypothetical protein